MKKSLLSIIVIALISCLSPVPDAGAYNLKGMEQVAFFLADSEADADSFVSLFFDDSISGFNLQYSLDGADWFPYTNGLEIDTGSNGGEVITYWRVKENNGKSHHAGGDLFLTLGSDLNGLYDGVAIQWDNIGLTFGYVSGLDLAMAPMMPVPVPLPRTLLLLGSGLLGMAVLGGRKISKLNGH